MPVIEPARIPLSSAADIAGVSRRALQQAAQAWDAGRHGLETVQRYVSAAEGQLFEGRLRLTTRDWLQAYLDGRRKHRYRVQDGDQRRLRWGSVELYRWQDDPEGLRNAAGLWNAAEHEAYQRAATPGPIVVTDRDGYRHEELRDELVSALGLPDGAEILMQEFRAYRRGDDGRPADTQPLSWIVAGIDTMERTGLAIVRRRGYPGAQ